jgi:hypothetical protein
MKKEELQKLINLAISKCNDSITTDWLAYCMLRSVDIEVLDEKIVEIKRSIKDGIPAVGQILLIDNDFYQTQSQNWKDEYRLICRDEFSICIEEVIDINFFDENFITIKNKKIFLKFDDPDKNLQ